MNNSEIQFGSSPLGLVMYNDTQKVKIGQYVLSGTSSLYKSLFSRDSEGNHDYEFDYSVENASTYQLSTQSIIEYSRNHPMMTLKYADFAYLKNLGVYPNNRLIIARRYPSPVEDDLINHEVTRTANSSPMATLISWVPDNEDFFSVDFGEDWDEAPTSFAEILNHAAENTDILAGDNEKGKLGTMLSEGINVIPLRGWSEGLQYQIFRELGLTELGPNDLPTGNPNLIRSAKARSVAGKTGRFEGVKATVSVKMVIEYEQKFISGLDPTTVYYDIIANALNFGTSNSKFMFNKDVLSSNDFSKFLDNLGSGDPKLVWQALQTFGNALKEALNKVIKVVENKLTELNKARKAAQEKAKEEGSGVVGQVLEGAGAVGAMLANSLLGVLLNVVAGVVSKYKVKLVGVLNALTGAPSTPWHVTIGNPKRPIFSSGDMEVDTVKVTFGKLLAYNDLPSSVKIELDLKNARALGKQEIFRKLNCGRARSYKQVRLDLNSVDYKVNNNEIVMVDEAGNANSNSNNSDKAGPRLTNLGNPIRPVGASAIGITPKSPFVTGFQLPAQPARTDAEIKKDVACQGAFNNIVRAMSAEVRAGSGGIFRPGKGTFDDDEDVMAKIFRREFTVGRYASMYTDATRCPHVKKLLDEVMSKIETGIRKGSGFTTINLYSPPGGNIVVGHDP